MLKKSLLLMLLMALLVPWAANAQGTLPVCEGTTQNQLIPFYAYSGDTQGCNSEFIIPASELTALNGKTITAITFSVAQQQSKTWTATYNVYLAEVSSTTLTTTLGPSAGTIVYTGTVDASSSEMTITFDDDYTYNGGNLLVGTYVQTAGAWDSSGKFYGIEAEGAAYITGTWGGSDDGGVDFIPQTTFTYLTDDPWISLNTSSMIVITGSTQDLTASYGNVTGTPTIAYSSSNSKVASVIGNGTTATVTGESAGTATITAMMVYNAENYYAYCEVTVEEPSYCSPTFGNPSDDHITNFTTTGGETNINNSSTYETGGYSDYYETASASIQAGETLSCTVTPSSTQWSYGHAIWVDWNKNYEFESDERVAYSTSTATGNWTGEFEVPSTTAAGDYRLRVLHVYNVGNVTNPCYSADYGEGEDYKLTVIAGNPYQKPTNLTVTDLGPFNATIGWTAPSTDVVNYQYQYMPEGGDWTSPKTTTALTAPLNDLTDETDYTFRVQAIYDGGESDFATIAFTTEVACEAPTEFHAENITAFTADLKWTSTVGEYEVNYAPYTGTPEVLQYDNGTIATNVGYGGEICWGVMYPAGSFTGNYLSKVSNYDVDEMTGNLYIYSGGTTAPEKLIASKAIEFTGADDFVDINFDQLVEVDPSQNLWIVIQQTGGANYPAAAAVDPGDANARWASLDGGISWGDLADYGLPDYGWMIRANIETISLTGTGTSWTDNTYPLTGLTQKTKYAAQVRNVCGGIYGESAWVTTLFSTTASCVAPEGLAISGEVTAREASFTWTADEVTFQYCVIANPAPGYTPIDKEFNHETTGNTATCVELTPDTDYVFYLRKKCSDTDFSEIVSIAFRTELACYAPESLTVDDIATYSATLNWTGTDGDYDVRYGLYPTSTAQEWLTYGITQSSNLGSSTASLRTWGVKYESSEITGNFLTQIEIPYVPGYNSNDYIILAVYSGGDNAPRNLLSTEVLYPEIDGMNTITLANPVAIPSGQNLWITLSEYGTYVVPFGASTEENAQWYFNGTEWTLWPYMVSNEYGCVINGYMETLDIDNVEWTNATSTTGSYPMSGLTASTQYMAQVRHNCGGEDGESIWWTAQFTTDVACPVPTDLVASDITGHEATLSWTGDTDANYNVAYRTSAYFDGLYEEFTTTSAPSGWTKLSGAFLNDDGTTSATSTTGGWSFNTNKFSSIHAYMNMYSNWKYWLITPSIEIAAGCSFSFDVAYTAYNSTSAAGTTGTDDKFCVLISTDEKAHWTILREWNNDGTGDAVLNDIPTTFQTISDIDLSAYKGQTVYIAFYGGSTESNTDNTLRIDNVMVGTPVAAGAWQETTAKTNSKQLNGLLAETKYDAKVQKDCDPLGASDWSDIISFTTDIACYPATGLAYDNVKSNRVDLTWTSEADAWVLAYKLDTDADFTEIALTSSDVTVEGTTVTYQLTGLTPEKEYAVKVRNNCGGGDLSAWTNVITFETLAACAQPTGVTVDNIGHYTADVAWTGDSEYYIVQYRTAATLTDVTTEDFSADPTGWLKRQGVLNTDGTAALSGTTSWSRGNNCGVFDAHMYMNLYGTTNYWYITPSMDIPDNYALSFDLAYTKYSSGSTNTAPATGCTTHRFAVLISTDEMEHWTILREWNNSGSEYVLDEVSQHGQNTGNIDLSAYAKSTAYIAFFAHSETTSFDNNMHFDNVSFGTVVPAGSWQTLSPNPTTTAANLTSLTAGIKYDVKVAPSCDETLESETVSFTTVADNVKIFLTEGTWGTADNWLDNLMPTLADNVQLQANATIASTDVAEADKITLNGKTLTINDGGQLKTNNSVTATVKKNISHYNYSGDPVDPEHPADGYYLIANPLNSTVYSYNFGPTGLLTGNYDLYSWSYSSSDGKEWRNYKASSFSLSTQTGYLYANEEDTDLAFTGTIRANDLELSMSLNYHTSGTYALNGWNLVGNPFACDAYVKDASEGIAFYRMNEAGNGFEAATGAIKPMEGIFVKATASGQSFTFTRTNPDTDNGTGNLNILVAENVNSRDAHASTDNAIVRFGNANTLEKFSFRENSTKMYIPQDSKKYAVVSAEASGTLPLNLKVEKTGSYTISFSNEDVEFTYLHLIDGITGEDIDLLVEGSYTFNASVRDRENRFTLVFNSIDSNIDATSDIFVYQNDDQIVVSGEGELQVYDVMGRFVGSYNVNGTETLNASQFANNVYIFRLVGETVKTQKIVVR